MYEQLKKFAAAVQDHQASHKRMVEAMQETFTPGKVIRYKHGRRWISALVLDDDNHSRLKVRGATGKEYWIHATSTLD